MSNFNLAAGEFLDDGISKKPSANQKKILGIRYPRLIGYLSFVCWFLGLVLIVWTAKQS